MSDQETNHKENAKESIERRNYKTSIRLSLAHEIETSPDVLDKVSDLLTTLVLIMKYAPPDFSFAIFNSIVNHLPEDKQFEFVATWINRMMNKYYKLQSIMSRFAPRTSSGGGDWMTMVMRMMMEERNRQAMETQFAQPENRVISRIKVEKNEVLEKLLLGDDENGEQDNHEDGEQSNQ